MKISINKNIMMFLINIMINTYLIMYILQVYDIPFWSLAIRMIVMIVLSVYIGSNFIKTLMSQRICYLEGSFWVYLLYVLFLLMIQNRFTSSDFLNELFVPVIFLSTFYSCHEITSTQFDKYNRLQIIWLFIFFALFLYAAFILQRTHGLFINSSYYTALMIPFLMNEKNKFFIFMGIIAILVPSLIVAKRTTLLAILAFFMAYKFSSYKSKGLGKNDFRLLFIIIACFVSIYISSFNLVLDRFLSILDDGGSGRLELFGTMLNMIMESNAYYLLIGHGAYTSSIYMGLSSHNDFLEVLWSYGVIGFTIYLNLFFALYIRAKSSKNISGRIYKIFLSTIVLWIFCSSVTHLIYVASYVASLFICFAICSARIDSLKHSVISIQKNDVR